jgi:hypothetical protein
MTARFRIEESARVRADCPTTRQGKMPDLRDSCAKRNSRFHFLICRNPDSHPDRTGLSGILSQKLSKGWSSDRPFFCPFSTRRDSRKQRFGNRRARPGVVDFSACRTPRDRLYRSAQS